MTYLFQNEQNTDAFGRLRVSTPLTLFDSSHRYSDNGLWATANTSGSTATFNTSQGLVDLSVTSDSGSSVVRETIKVFAYQPGKSLLVLNTFVMSPAKPNLVQRIGYFGADNGMFIELDGSNLYFVERSSVSGALVETHIPQSQWNYDVFDGNGASGITLDISKAQIMFMDIEWLGLGSVRMGFVIDGKFYLAHTFHHANSITSTYITTACLPIRYEIFNSAATSGASTLKQICSSVISEGGYELRGKQAAVSTPIGTPFTLTSASTYYPVISIRLKSTRLDAIAIITALSVLPTTQGNFHWRLNSGGVTTGGTWVSAGTDSSIEYNITGTSYTDGRALAAGFTSATNQSASSVDILRDALFKFQLERNGLTSTPYEITLNVASDGAADTIFANLDWEEVSR